MSFDVCKVDHYAWGAAFHSPVSWWQCEIAGMWYSGWDTKQNYNASTGLGQEKAGGQHVHKHLKDMQRHAIQLLPSKCIKLHGPIQCFCKRLWSMLPCILCMISSVVFSNFTVSLLLPSADTSYTHPMMLWNQGSVTETSVLFSPNFRYRDLKLQDYVLEECRSIEGLLIVSFLFSDRRDHWHFTKASRLHS